MSRRPPALLAAGLVLVAVACGGTEPEAEAFVTGSSTVEPISVRVAELLEDVEPALFVDVEGPGTGDGFEKFCGGDAEIADASRPIAPSEAETCAANGIEFVELQVAFDGISVITSAENDAVDCVNFADLYALVGPEAEGFDNWSDGAELAGELGSTTELPDLRLDVIGPGEESGTYDSFVEIVLEGIAEERAADGHLAEEDVAVTRPDYSSQSDDNAILQGIEGATGSLGWVGYAFAREAGDGIKQLAVDGGGGCVAPSAETIADGTYPISRPLYIYVNVRAAEENAAVAAYVEHYLDEGLAAVEEVGYVPLPDDQLTATREAWRKALGTGAS